MVDIANIPFVTQERPEVITADIAMQAIGLLYSMIQKGEPHTEQSNAVVVGAMCHLRDIRKGRALPFAAPAFEDAAKDELVQSMTRTLDEMTEALHASDLLEQRANSQMLVAEEFAEYYRTLRDDVESPFIIMCKMADGDGSAQMVEGEQLDNLLEDYLAAKVAKAEPDQEFLDMQTPL